MPEIREMPAQLANLIAAGEIIDRPAAVVRELVENSVDAGATRVSVEIRRGGITFIRVTDDGCGIPPKEVPTAFRRHATSKLYTEEDLARIGTLGFRGEALAAISSVAYMTMMTKPKTQPVGYSYTVEYGKIKEQGEVGCPNGTTVIVRSLFFALPDKHKFLKKDGIEGAAVLEVLQREALAHPEVSFSLTRDGAKALFSPGDGDIANAVYSVLGDDLGLDLAPLGQRHGDMWAEGFITKPTACLGSRHRQFFFVNGRYVRSKVLTAALEEGFRNFQMVGRYPGGVVYLTIPPEAVDVNQDPAKQEVRFALDAQVYECVYQGVVAALRGKVDRPSLGPQEDKLLLCSPQDPRANITPQDPRVQELEKAGGLSQEMTDPPANAPLGAGEDLSSAAPSPETHQIPTGPAPEAHHLPTGTPPIPHRPEPILSTPGEELPPDTLWKEPEGEPEQLDLLPPPERDWKIAGEVFNTYIIVEKGDKIIFIDKHAAHERMGFDALKAQDYRPMCQELLTPRLVRPGPQGAAVLLENIPLLEEFGFHIEEFGDHQIVVRMVPDYLEIGEISNTLEDLAEKLKTTGTADPAAQRDAVMHTMACKAAMKGGQKTTPQELERVAQAVMSGQVTHCPHGRPVAVELTKYELERKFKRR